MGPYSFNCVLLVDDDGVTNFINHRLIKKLNLTTCIQSSMNGNEALRYIKDFSSQNDQHCPELILLDINMPVLDGFEFLEEFEKLELKNRDKVKIIVLTTSTHQKDVMKIARDAKIGYINKPLTEEKLIDCLKSAAQEARGMA